jgi:hypothetical protein
MIISRSFLHRIKHISDRFVEKITTHILGSLIIFLENRIVYEINEKKYCSAEQSRMIKWRMRIAFWKTKATNTHSEFVILMVLPL